MINCSIDCSLTIRHYVFEVSFWLKDWRLAAETHSGNAFRVLQIGPLAFSVMNLKRLKELYGSKPQPVSLDDLADL
jgi:hypothetical protein